MNSLPGLPGGISDFNLIFLTGFFVVNTMAYLLFFALPFSISTDYILVCMLAATAALIKIRVSRLRILRFDTSKRGLPAFLALSLILIGTSFWAQSSLHPSTEQGDLTVFKPWLDGFFHAQKIWAIATSHGFTKMNNPMQSGEPAALYHYASYIFPAELCAFTPTTAYQAFCSFWVPLGLMLVGLAAYIMVGAFWGPGAGFAACAFIIVLPDSSQMGMSNPWLSYHWLQQAAPAGAYGVALMALAWIFMFEGCRRGSVPAILMSYCLWCVTGNYKVQIFLGNTLPMAVYPALFFSRYSKRTKSIWLVASLLALGCMMKSTEFIPLVPLVRFDGSALAQYTAFVISMFESDFLKHVFMLKLSTPFQVINLCWTVALRTSMLLVCTFGMVGFLCIVLTRLPPEKKDMGLPLFPLIVVLNYLAMSMGLAYDTHRIGMPEELLHRPFVWGYFVVAAWAGGLTYLRFQERLRRNSGVQKAILAMAFLLTCFPLCLGKRVQAGPAASWGEPLTDIAVPTGLVRSCEFIRAHGNPKDIVQDSQNDKKAILTALSERQSYVIDYMNSQLNGSPGQKERLREILSVKKMTDPNAVVNFFFQRNIKWFVLHPKEYVPWPKEIATRRVFSSGGYEVYLFGS